MKTEIAELAGGCFWNTEAAFSELKGVVSTEVGYEGGHAKQPTYEKVCNLETGHAETVRVKFDPTKVSYREILEYFFKIHDPTQVNRQGPDVGENYRSAIFYRSQGQKATAEAVISKLQPKFNQPIATQLKPSTEFWRAEEYHQQYLAKQGRG